MTERPRGFAQPQAAADLVKNILHQKVEDAKQAKAEALKARKRKSRVPLLLGLLPVLVALTAWNVLHGGPTPSVLSPADQLASVKFRIYLAAQAIDGYQTVHGSFPPDLSVVGVDWQGLHYVPAETTWSIVARADSVSIMYRHGEPLGPYATAYQALQRRRP